MKTFTVRSYRGGKIDMEWKPYKQEARALKQLRQVMLNRLNEKSDILVKEYGEYENAGQYKEYVISLPKSD